MEVYLILDHNKEQKSILLRDKLLIGRNSTCNIALQSETLSGRHCLLSIKDNCVLIEDLKSKNGTFINNVRIMSTKLFLGDRVTFGDAKLVIDPIKNNQEIKNLLTYKGTHQRNSGELTLELENTVIIRSKAKEIKEQMEKGEFKTTSSQEKYLKETKLYEGVPNQDNTKKESSTLNKKLNYIKIFIASFISTLSFLIVFLIPILIFKLTWATNGALNKETLSSKVGLFSVGLGIFFTLLLKRWSSKRDKSIGESILRI